MFHQLSLLPREFHSTSINISCTQETFHQLPSTFRAARRPLSTFSNFCTAERPSNNIRQIACGRETICQLPLTFRVAGRPSVKFCQHFVQPRDLPSVSVKFWCIQLYFRELPSTFCVAGRHCVNFHKHCAIRRPSVNIHQIFMQLGDLPSTSVKLLCSRENICQLPSSFRAGR